MLFILRQTIANVELKYYWRQEITSNVLFA